MRKMPFSESFTPEHLAELTDGFSGAEIASLCQNSAIRSLERDISSLKVPLFIMTHASFSLFFRSNGKTLSSVFLNLKNKLIVNP